MIQCEQGVHWNSLQVVSIGKLDAYKSAGNTTGLYILV